MNLDQNKKIYIAGHTGMVGSATLKLFKQQGFKNIVSKTSVELNLTNQLLVHDFFKKEKPEIVILAAAKVGGIQANIDHPASFLIDNLLIQNNIIQASHKFGVGKIVFLGSSCIYPKECPQPMKEEYLLTGRLEPTNEGYALAKIAGLKLLEGYYTEFGMKGISLMPCNLYGPNDSFDLRNSHVLSALIKKIIDARDNKEHQVTLWGTGIARREFMHVDDMAEAILFMLEHYEQKKFINIGCGYDLSIKELAEIIIKKSEFKGEIKWDDTKPNGMLRKCMDVSRMKQMGFMPKISLEQGVEQMINIYQQNKNIR